MATVAKAPSAKRRIGGPIARAVDRWIFVGMAAMFILVTLTGFIPDSVGLVAAVRSGQRPPLPIALHVHAVLMGSFLLLLFAQTLLMARGRCELHKRLGRLAMVLVPTMVVVGFILVPTMYHLVAAAAQSASGPDRAAFQQELSVRDDIMLLQLRIGFLFPLFIAIGLRARKVDGELHKRMMILATVMALPAAVDRITWLPTSMPVSAISTDLYTLLLVSPMFFWDLWRSGTIGKAYRIWMGVNLPFAALVYLLWGTPGWHFVAHRLMGA